MTATDAAIPDDPRLDGWQMDPETLADLVRAVSS